MAGVELSQCSCPEESRSALPEGEGVAPVCGESAAITPGQPSPGEHWVARGGHMSIGCYGVWPCEHWVARG